MLPSAPAVLFSNDASDLVLAAALSPTERPPQLVKQFGSNLFRLFSEGFRRGSYKGRNEWKGYRTHPRPEVARMKVKRDLCDVDQFCLYTQITGDAVRLH